MGFFSSLFGGKKKEIEDNFGGLRSSDIGNDFRPDLDDADPDKVWKDDYATREMLMMWPHFNNLESLEPLYAQAWETKQLMTNGRRLYSSMPFWALTEMDRGTFSSDVYTTKMGELAAGGSPFWAAMYALTIASLGLDARGTAWASETSEEQMVAHNTAMRAARDLLDASESQAGDLHLWHHASYVIGISEGAPREVSDARFERLWALDRDNLAVISVRGHNLLPRWIGAPDGSEVDAFARHAAEVTKDTFGKGAYAAAYFQFISVGSLKASDITIDTQLLREALADLKSRFKGPWMKSEEIATLAFAEDWDTIRERYESGWRKYVESTFSDNGDKATTLADRVIRRAVTGKE